MGGGKLEDENKALLEEVERLRDQNAALVEELVAKKPKKLRALNEYDLVNLNKFLKTEDEILKHPEVFEYEEGVTAFDKNLSRNANYYRPYQKKFIEDCRYHPKKS
jgi:molybdopterin converting factor small subunit